jgi:transcriptional regulator with XRE-family HTH domain
MVLVRDLRVGPLLREWRERRRLSQLELALQAEVSTRHLSFVETGRAAPSRGMVLQLAEALDIPLRERNQLLLAAGYAPHFSEQSLDAPDLRTIRDAMQRLLHAQLPNPALVLDRYWNIVDANAAVSLFVGDLPASLKAPPLNVMRATLHPAGLARNIVNRQEWRAHLLGRLQRQIAQSGDAELERLYAEVRSYDGARHDETESHDVIVPLRYRFHEHELAFFSTVATFGAPLDITVAELAIELFFPADEATATFLRNRD